MYEIDSLGNRHPSGMHAGFKKEENKRLDNELLDFSRKGKPESSPVFKQSRQSRKLLSLQPKRDLEAHPEKTRGSLGTKKTGTQFNNGSKVLKRRSLRHTGHIRPSRQGNRNSELRERRDLRLKRLSSSYNQDKSVRLAARLKRLSQ